MKKQWVFVGVVVVILVVGLGLIGYFKVSKKNISSNPQPSNQEVAGQSTGSKKFFADDASVMFFYSDYCHWCQKEESEVLPTLGDQGYRLKPMNVGNQPELAKQYNISGTPTFIAKNGDRLVGFQTVDQLKPWLDQHK